MKQVFRRLAFLLVLLAVLLSVCYMLWPHSFADLQPECDSVTILRSDTAEDYSYTITKEIYSTDSPELKQIMDILSHYTYHRSLQGRKSQSRHLEQRYPYCCGSGLPPCL